MAEQVLAGRHRARIELRQRRLQLVVQRIARPPRTRTADSRAASSHRRSPSRGRSGRWHRPRAVRRCRSPPARPRCGGGPHRSSRRRSSSSPRCSRDRDSCASRRAARRRPCPDSSSRRQHRRTRADRRRRHAARPAGGTAACRAIFATASHTAMSMRADRDRALAVTARLLVRHHRRPDAMRIEIVAARRRAACAGPPPAGAARIARGSARPDRSGRSS